MKKGQIVYVNTINNAARRGTEIFQAKVTSVGRKYFYLEAEGRWLDRTKFDIDRMVEHSNYSPDYEVYLSLEDCENATKKPQLLKDIQSQLHKYNYTNLVKIRDFVNSL